MHAGSTGIAVVPALGPDAKLLPECIESAVAPLLEHVGFVIAMVPQRRMARLPRHTVEPVAYILGRQRRLHHRIRPRLRGNQRVAERPGGLFELERAGLANARPPRVGESAAIQHLCHQPGRIEAAQRGLCVRRVRQPGRADPAVTPVLCTQPGAGVEAVLAVRQIFDEPSLGAVTAPRVLIHHGIAMRVEIRSQFGAARRRAVGGGDLAAAGQVPTVRRALHDHRKRAGAAGQVQIRGKTHAVPHRHEHGFHRHHGAPTHSVN